MRLTDIAINNLRVRRTKMIFLILGMVIGIATIVTLFSITGAMREELRAQFADIGAKIIIAPYAEKLSLSYSGVTVASAVSFTAAELPRSAVDGIQGLPGASSVKIFAPKLLSVAQLDGGSYLVVGVDFFSELQLNRHWEVNGSSPPSPGEILLGYAAAARLGKRAGDSLTIEGTSLRVAGVLAEMGSQEDPLVFIDLKQAQSIFGKKDAVSFMEVTVTEEAGNQPSPAASTPAAEQLVAQIKQKIPEVSAAVVKDQGAARKEMTDRFARFSMLITVIVFWIGALIIGSTMMSSVNERTREIGIFRAIGFRQSHIMQVILTEAALVSAAGGILGYLAGMGAATLIAPLVAQIQVGIQWNFWLGLVVVLLSVLVGLGASLYPAIRAARLDPAEAIRFI